MPKGVERAQRAQQFSGADRRAMVEKARQSRQMRAQEASPRKEKAQAAQSSMKARQAAGRKEAAAAQRKDHAHDLRQARKDQVNISKEGKTAQKADARRQTAAKPEMNRPQARNMQARGYNSPGAMGNMPISGSQQGMKTGATPQFSERTGLSFGGKG